MEIEFLIWTLANDPEAGVVMRGTGGMRKMRVAMEGRGKSGGARAVYFYRNEAMPLFLVGAFAKSDRANLSKAEQNDLARLAKAIVETW